MSSGELELDRTYYKIGKTERTAKERVYEQLKTAMPEEPIIQRVYALDKDSIKDVAAELRSIEEAFHDLLKLSNQKYANSKNIGDEWFLTNLDFLDEIAAILNLKIYGE